MRELATRWLLAGLLLALVTSGCAKKYNQEDYYERETIHRESFPETYRRDPWDGPATYGRY